jgi:hypothetical protein
MAQAFGIVHVFVSGKPPEHGLPQQPDQSMAAVLAGACVGERLARNRAEAEGIIEFTIGQQARIGSDDGAAKLERQSAVDAGFTLCLPRTRTRALWGLTRG